MVHIAIIQVEEKKVILWPSGPYIKCAAFGDEMLFVEFRRVMDVILDLIRARSRARSCQQTKQLHDQLWDTQ
jgi:hypothetical protein